MNVKRLQKLAGLLKEDDLDLANAPEFKSSLIRSKDIPDGWEEADMDPEVDPYILYFKFEEGRYDPLTDARYAYVAIGEHLDNGKPKFDVTVSYGTWVEESELLDTFEEAWQLARREMESLRDEIDSEDSFEDPD